MTADQTQGSFCQSCAMPMKERADFGTEADGRTSGDYCRYCYQGGKFTDRNATMQGMIEKCASMMKQMNMPDEDIEKTKKFIPTLKRWRAC